VQLTINGSERIINDAETVEEMLRALDLDPRGVVVELNRSIVRRALIAATPVRDGDVVEIVHFVGGG
jgi:sulfur carrier protein